MNRDDHATPLSAAFHDSAIRTLSCVAFLMACFIAWYADLLFLLPDAFHRYVVKGDFGNQFVPFQHFAAEEWWSGRIPLWNPYFYGGQPFQADPQSAVFYVPGMLFDLAFGRQGLSFTAMEWRATLAYSLGAAFTYLFAQRITANHVGGIIAAFVFAGSGFLTSYPMQQLPILEAVIWLPLCLYCIERAVEKQGLSLCWTALAACALGLSFLAGHTQTTMFAGYVAVAYLLMRAIQTKQRWWRVALGGLAITLTFGGLALPQLLPTLQFTELSNRQLLSYEEAGGGYDLGDLVELLSPQGLFQRGYYVGVASLVFMVPALGRRHAQRIFWLVVAGVGVLLALGAHGPLYPIFYHVLPAYALFKDQERAAMLWAFAAAVLSAIGWAGLWRTTPPSSTITSLILSFAIGASGCVAGIVLLAQPVSAENPASVISPDVAVLSGVLVAIAASALALGAVRGAFSYASAAFAGLLLVASPLYGVNHANNRSVVSATPAPAVAGVMTFAQAQPDLFRLWELQDILPGDLGVLYHVAVPFGDSPIYNRRVRTLLETHQQYSLAQLFNVRYLVANVADGGPGTSLLFTSGELYVYKRDFGLPRAFAVRDVLLASDDKAELDMSLHMPHPGSSVVLTQQPELHPTGPDLPRDQHETWQHYDAITRDLLVSVTDDAVLVVLEPYYPGWEAMLDGRVVPIYRADYAFQAIDLPAGTHQVRFRFRPGMLVLGVELGATLMALALALLVLDRLLSYPTSTKPSRASPSDEPSTGKRLSVARSYTATLMPYCPFARLSGNSITCLSGTVSLVRHVVVALEPPCGSCGCPSLCATSVPAESSNWTLTV